MMICEPFSIVAVPFPFTDRDHAKRRPALIISTLEHQRQTQHATLLMITTAKNSAWLSDYPISTLSSTGLTTPSIVRQKLFTVEVSLIIKVIGRLAPLDVKEILQKLKEHLYIDHNTL